MALKVAYLGPEGTYTHQAVTQQFGNDPKQVQISSQKAIADCFEAVYTGDADFSVVPFENSTNGQVVYTYDLLRDWFLPSTKHTESLPTPPGTASDIVDNGTKKANFNIVAEQFVSIHHNFITNAKSITDVTTIYSHPQVWTQVSAFLKSLNLPATVSKIDTSSTSRAAELVLEDTTNTTACISSQMAAEVYGLPILYKNIEDNASNTTRFLVLGRTTPPNPPSPENPSVPSGPPATYITSIIFTLNHDDPGALVDVLNGFRKHGVNLTSINSRPSHLRNWQYIFFVELKGNNAIDDNVKKSIEEVKGGCLDLVVLGSFGRSWRYKSNGV